MTVSSEDDWPKNYQVGPPKHMHAIGVIIINYTRLEVSLFSLFFHHLKRNGLDVRVAWQLYNGLPDNKKTKAIQHVFDFYEKDPDVRECVSDIIDRYNICSGNRNHFGHAHDYVNAAGGDIGELTKVVNSNWDMMNKLQLDLPTLRRIADDMHATFNYLSDVWAYLQPRDLLEEPLQDFLAPLWPKSLPKRPPPPLGLIPFQTPHNSI